MFVVLLPTTSGPPPAAQAGFEVRDVEGGVVVVGVFGSLGLAFPGREGGEVDGPVVRVDGHQEGDDDLRHAPEAVIRRDLRGEVEQLDEGALGVLDGFVGAFVVAYSLLQVLEGLVDGQTLEVGRRRHFGDHIRLQDVLVVADRLQVDDRVGAPPGDGLSPGLGGIRRVEQRDVAAAAALFVVVAVTREPLDGRVQDLHRELLS
mmetsp:Transcript_23077/g.74257  ORF Transcript_23077/g.74257 Transcript_23077/m.74257 type:complete len:204 (-) Transcript_23077:360-971(-)